MYVCYVSIKFTFHLRKYWALLTFPLFGILAPGCKVKAKIDFETLTSSVYLLTSNKKYTLRITGVFRLNALGVYSEKWLFFDILPK